MASLLARLQYRLGDRKSKLGMQEPALKCHLARFYIKPAKLHKESAEKRVSYPSLIQEKINCTMSLFFGFPF
uniref:Uncharacterized protein n=1 Tax=Nelumbo nucifera TaxID=4432 RepID=A0A822XVM6_NELNU|nr:TPA_asm: hypothetical protein HUJ06_024684 [Nelumbo nucifera]DAD23223.1 TPA_asm: hypothetical protein HUJ06_024686 [Nelumbo nucifera]